MKTKLFIKVVNNQFVLVEQKMVVQEVELTTSANYADLGAVIETAGYKTAQASPEARALANAQRKALRDAQDVKRQERLAKREAKKAEAIAKLEARIAKLKQ